MTYQQALLIIHNPDAYSREEVRKAASFVLGTMGARQDDLTAAMMAV